MKTTFYFFHETSARNDVKLIRLKAKHGNKGIGVFWQIVEMLYEVDGYLKEEDSPAIAYELREEEAVIKSIIHEFDLFVLKDGLFTSTNILEQLEDRMRTSETAEIILEKDGKDIKVNQLIRPYYCRITMVVRPIYKERREKERKV